MKAVYRTAFSLEGGIGTDTKYSGIQKLWLIQKMGKQPVTWSRHFFVHSDVIDVVRNGISHLSDVDLSLKENS